MTTTLPPRPENKGTEAEPRSLLEEKDSGSHVRIQVTEADALVGHGMRWFAGLPVVKKGAAWLVAALVSLMAAYGTCTVHDDSRRGEEMSSKMTSLSERAASLSEAIALLSAAQRSDTAKIVESLDKLAENVARLNRESEEARGDIKVLRVELTGQQKQLDSLDRTIAEILRRKWMTEQ